jgi:hypothetical protein
MKISNVRKKLLIEGNCINGSRNGVYYGGNGGGLGGCRLGGWVVVVDSSCSSFLWW